MSARPRRARQIPFPVAGPAARRQGTAVHRDHHMALPQAPRMRRPPVVNPRRMPQVRRSGRRRRRRGGRRSSCRPRRRSSPQAPAWYSSAGRGSAAGAGTTCFGRTPGGMRALAVCGTVQISSTAAVRGTSGPAQISTGMFRGIGRSEPVVVDADEPTILPGSGRARAGHGDRIRPGQGRACSGGPLGTAPAAPGRSAGAAPVGRPGAPRPAGEAPGGCARCGTRPDVRLSTAARTGDG